VFCGDVVTAHRAACSAAATEFATPVHRTYDCVLLNAFPKDIDLVQAANAFVAWKTARRPVVHEGGLVVLMTAASQGIGQHGLFQPGGLSYRAPGPLRNLQGRDLWLYCPSLDPEEVRQLYWEGYRIFSTLEALASAMEERLPIGARIGVFPCAPMQQVVDLR
jgi:lactate racemase